MKVVYLKPKWRSYKGLDDKYVEFIRRAVNGAGDEFVKEGAGDNFGDVVISWNSRPSRICSKISPRHIVVEKGHLGSRSGNLSFTFNDLAGQGEPVLPQALWEGRGKKWYDKIALEKSIEPKSIIIMGQVAKDRSLSVFGFGGTGNQTKDHLGREAAYNSWVLSTCKYWESKGMEVSFKIHPKERNKNAKISLYKRNGVKIASNDMQECLSTVDAATAMTSTSLIESFLNGLYVVPCHTMSLAWPVRSSWGNWRQYTVHEKKKWLDWVASHQMTRKEFIKYWPKIKENL